MDNTNIPPFYIGETVEYITGISMPKGTKVVVSDIALDSCKCGWIIQINGNKLEPQPKDKYTHCEGCGEVHNNLIYNDAWLASSFRRISKYPLIKLSKVTEQELIAN